MNNTNKITTSINHVIRDLKDTGNLDTNDISDGYHTFGELYDHRIALFIALCKQINRSSGPTSPVWKSEKHSDGSSFEGWFVMGIFSESGRQITYHLPSYMWRECHFAKILEKAPYFDGHTAEDVLERLKTVL